MRCCLACLLILSGCASSFADEKPGDPIEGWGVVVDPDDDCEVEVDEDRLTIHFGPGGHGLDAENKGKMNSPRILHTLEEDFSIQVTVDGDLPLPDPDIVKTRAYISGGLLLLRNHDNYIRLERASFTRNGTVWHYTNFEQRIDAKRTRMGRFADFPLQADKPVDLRLEVSGESVRALVRHVGDDWHEMGTARIEDRAELLAGVSGVKTDAARAMVSFRDLRVSTDCVAADAKSESEIDLNEMMDIIRVPGQSNEAWKQLIAQVLQLQKRAMEIETLSEAQQTELIEDAKRLGSRRTPERNSYLGPSLARRLAANFRDAGMPEQAIRVHREVAETLESLRTKSLKPAIQSLRRAADRWEAELRETNR